jgi:hypothetical protein
VIATSLPDGPRVASIAEHQGLLAHLLMPVRARQDSNNVNSHQKGVAMKPISVGVWVWGIATVLLAVLSLFIVFCAGLYLNVRAEFAATVPARLPGLYLALKENGTLVAGLLGISGLAWVLYVRRDRDGR